MRVPQIKVREAETQAAEEAWQCLTCSFPAQESSQYCLHCELYWKDVDNGLFDLEAKLWRMK